MIYDKHGRLVTPVKYVRSSMIVTVRYADGTTAELPFAELTSPKYGEGYIAEQVRLVRIP